MISTPSPRAIVCPGCRKLILAGRRGPLPTRCAQCRGYKVLPERAAGRTTCSTCGTDLPIVGRRGRVPRFCRSCWRERRRRAEAGRRLLRHRRPALSSPCEPDTRP